MKFVIALLALLVSLFAGGQKSNQPLAADSHIEQPMTPQGAAATLLYGITAEEGSAGLPAIS